LSPAAAPLPNNPGAWLGRYGELQDTLFLILGRRLGLAGPGGRDAFGDLFQVAATEAWTRERSGEPIRNPRAFLAKVILNQRKMQLRSQRRHPARSYDELAAETESAEGRAPAGLADKRPPVEQQIEQRELVTLLTHIVLTIEPRARKVWTMRCLDGHTPDEVTAALGVTRREYARLLERANIAINRKLRAYLAGDWCPGWAAKLARLAAGRATPAEAAEARGHLAGCPSCRAAYQTFTRLHPRA
jgi:RNA polymerase sigma factor (sigma-70 family)